jgi:ribosomal protein L7/L12
MGEGYMDGTAFIIGILLVILTIMSNNLSEMKEQLYRVNKTLEKMALQLGVKELDYVDDDEVLESVKYLVKKGKKIDAIKQYRIATGQGLKESKEKIDNLYETLKSNGEI